MVERYGSTISSGSITLSSVVRHGSSVGAWKAMPTCLSGPFTFSPAMLTTPRVAGRSPVASFMKVDLPQPDGPTMAMNSPGAACSEMSSTANSPRRASSSS
ncbi:hypothetical protein D3C86_1923850 [compost metagenome]